jgi:hypothetical protein
VIFAGGHRPPLQNFRHHVTARFPAPQDLPELNNFPLHLHHRLTAPRFNDRMLSTTNLHPNQSNFGAESCSNMNTFQWLLVLGFPPATAAASVMPELFVADETTAEKEADDAIPGIAA